MPKGPKKRNEYSKKEFVDTTTDGFKVSYRFAKRVPNNVFEFVKKHYIIKEALKFLQEINEQLERKPDIKDSDCDR